MDKTIKIFIYFLMVVISIWLYHHIKTDRDRIQADRFEIVGASTSTKPIAYRLDKWTGKTTVFVGPREVQTKKE